MEEEDTNEDNEIKKLSVVALNTIGLLVNHVPIQNTIFSNEVRF